jgi:hypothetical protein
MNRGSVSSIFTVFSRLFIGCLFYIGIVNAGPIDNLQPGEWYEIPNSHMRSVVMDPLPDGVYAVEGPSAVIHSWSGGAYDSQRDRLLVFGGGHTAYAGNEVYAFDLISMSWERLTDPSSITGYDNGKTYPDGNPVSVHSYDQLEYDPFADKLFVFGGSRYPTGSNTVGSFTFSPGTNKWTQVSDIPGDPYSEILGLSLTSAYDPVTKKIFIGGVWGIATYDVATDVWQILKTWYGTWELPNGLTAALDYKRRKFIQIGRGYSYVWDISQAKPSRQNLVTTGQTEILDCDAPGVDYDPVSDRIVAWCKGQDVYTLDLDNLVWERHTATGTVDPGDPYTFNSNYHGTFGRFRYVPSKNVFILVSDIDKNAYVYKLSPGSGAPTVPQNLSAKAVSDTQIDLNWSSSLGGSGLAGYNIYRDSVLLTTVTTNSFSDSGLSANTLYTYNVTAIDGNGDESGPSLPVSVTTPDSPVDTGSSGSGSSGTGASGTGASDTGSSGVGSIGWLILLIASANLAIRKYSRKLHQH